ALVSGSTVTIGGTPVSITISSTGEFTLSGLKNNGPASTYEFFVEAANQSQTGGNFCPYIGDVLTKATVFVNPPLNFTVNSSDDWCNDATGEIVASVSGASDITYTLLDANDQLLATNTTGIFSTLVSGDYKVFGTSVSLGCSSPIQDVRIEGPTDNLLIVPGAVENAFCSLPNGEISFEITGGNAPYQSVVVNGTNLPFDPSGIYSLQGLAANQYSITVTDAKGCTLSQTMDVLEDPASNFTTVGSEVCEGQVAYASIGINDPSTGIPVFNWYIDNGAGGYTLLTDNLVIGNITYNVNSSNELSVTGLPARSVPYLVYLRVTGAKICDQGYIPTEIKVTPGPEMNAPIVTETCFGESLGTIQAQIPGNNYADFEFSLSGDNGVFVDFAQNGGLFENLPAGTYQLSIKSALGCVTNLADIEVLEPSAPIALANQTIERASCDLANGTIKDIQIVGGWGGYTVEWRKGAIDGTIIPGDASGASNLSPDTYFLLVTDQKGCKMSFDFVVGELSDPVYGIVPPINDCFGETVEIRPIHIAPDPSLPPTAFTEVFWYRNPGQSGLITEGPDPTDPTIIYTIDDTDWLNPRLLIDGLPAGDYTYYFYVGCTGQEIEIDVEVFAIPEVLIETTPVSCFGGNDGKLIFISGTSTDYQYKVNSGAAMTQSALEAMNFTAGTYQLEVLTPAGCPQNVTFTVDGPAAALAVTPLTGVNPGCGALNGKLSATISGGWAPYQVTIIKNGTALQTIPDTGASFFIDGLSSGNYSLDIIDAQGCQINSNALDLVDGPSQILVDKQAVCEGQSVLFTPSIDPVAPGAGFEWYFDAALTQKIISSATPNAQGITYQINPASGSLSVNGLATSASPYQYYVIGVGSGVCPGFVANAEALVYGKPTATYTKLDEVCFGEGGTINVTASGGSGNYTFVLDGQISQDNGLFENVPKGIHSITVQTPETCEVTISDIEIIGSDSPLEAEIVEILNPTCEVANGRVTLAVRGGLADYVVEVFKNGVSQGTVVSDPSGAVIVSGIGQGQYVFEIKDALGCILSIGDPLDLVEVPTEISLQDQMICEGQDANLVPTVPANVNAPTYTWFFDEAMNNPLTSGSSNGVTYQINSAGELTISGLAANVQAYEYFAMVEGVGICGVSPKRVQVLVTAYPNLRVSNPSIVCDPDETVDLTNYIEGYNPSIYEYTIISPLGNALIGNEATSVDVSGNYEVSASVKGSGCFTDSKRILVRIAEELLQSNFQYHADQGDGIIISNEDIQILENVDFEDISTGEVIIWEWDFGDGASSSEQNPSHIYQKKGSYTVTLKTTDSIGCQSVYSILVQVKDDYLLIMPNAFTPDGLKNQFYKPKHRGLASLEFYVFNTWGELIYQSDSLEDLGWDGTVKGTPAPNGNYVYKVNYSTRSGLTFDQGGVFILIR
ncbi:MAG: PKD domain-containing protein, partial [Algoriphagus sp.]